MKLIAQRILERFSRQSLCKSYDGRRTTDILKMNRPRAMEMEEIPLWNILLDVTIIALSLSSTVIMVKNVNVFQAGFFCDDDTIRYPYQSSTITIGQLYAVSVIIPILTMSVVELWLQRRQKQKRQVLVAGWVAPEWMVRMVRQILLFGYGLGAIEIMVNVGKFTVGRLRPHFLDACKPSVMCNITDPHTYITDYVCTGTSNSAVFQSRLSFPSGHSSLAFYAAVFTVMYLENRIRWPERAIVGKTAFEMVILILAWYTALTRISDSKHHWQDVAVGSLMGTVGACIWVWRILRVQPEENGASEGRTDISDPATYVFSADDSRSHRKM